MPIPPISVTFFLSSLAFDFFSKHMANQISRIRVIAKKKNSQQEQTFFLQCSSLFLRAADSSLLNKETMVQQHQRRKPFFKLCLHQAGPPQWVNSLAPMRNMKQLCLSWTQRLIASSGIKPGVSNLSITNSTLYRLNYRRRIIFRHKALMASSQG